MSLRAWGIALLVAGVLAAGAGVYSGIEARAMWAAADARCAGDPGWCAPGETYLASVLLVAAPLGVLLGLALFAVGGVMIAVGRVVDRVLDHAVDRGFETVAGFLR